LSYINSTGIYNLLHCYTKAKEKGGYVKLVAVNDNIKEILDMIGVTKLLTPYPTLQDALVGLR
ncbi:MAG: STAS domain-containing protein, partial [Candidatus Omnitrophica bacterium]|nr:STAS domain-containing protein [Candidatus Omnitrophota bacterium]